MLWFLALLIVIAFWVLRRNQNNAGAASEVRLRAFLEAWAARDAEQFQALEARLRNIEAKLPGAAAPSQLPPEPPAIDIQAPQYSAPLPVSEPVIDPEPAIASAPEPLASHPIAELPSTEPPFEETSVAAEASVSEPTATQKIASLLPEVARTEVETILRRIGSWILVGEEHRPKGVSLEFAVASTWLMRTGILVLVACVAWFLKWSMDHGLLGPSGRVGLSFLVGVALLLAGYRQMGKRYQVLGQGFMGGGLAALYFAGYAAGPLYDLIPVLACFAVMALITLTGCVLAAMTASQVTAVLAMLGGYSTPILLSTGHPNFFGLYTYMTLLGTGVLGLAIAKNWRILHYLAFIAHWSLVLGSLKDYEQTRDFATVITFVTVFFAQQHGVILGYALRRAQAITWLEAVHQLGHTALFAGLAYRLIEPAAGRPWPAVMAMGLAALFIAQSFVVMKRMAQDRISVSVSLGLAGFFVAWSLALLFTGAGLAVAWSLMALTWLWIGLRLGSKLLVLGSQLLYLLVAMRLTTLDMPQAFYGLDALSAEPTFAAYWKGFAGRLLNFGVFIGSLFVASQLYRRHAESAAQSSARPSDSTDLPGSFSFGLAGAVIFYVGLAFAFVFANLELSRMLGHYWPLKSPGLVMLWVAFAGYLAWRHKHQPSQALGLVAWVAALAVVLRLIVYDWNVLGFALWDWRFDHLGASLAYRSVAHLTVIALLVLFSLGRFGTLDWVGADAKPPTTGGLTPKSAATFMATLATALALAILTIEVQTITSMLLPAFKAGAVSVLWGLYAMGLLAFGLSRDARRVRLAGLALFAIVAAKVFLLDLSQLDMIWRVLSFMLVGAMLLLGSFAYLRASKSAS